MFNRCLRQENVEAPRLRQKMATQILANVEVEWMSERRGIFFETLKKREHIKYAALRGPTTFGSCPTQKKYGTDGTRPYRGGQWVGPDTQTCESVVDKYV